MTTLLCLFAHPDDEAFGPAGIIATLAESYDVKIVSLCNGRRPGADDSVMPARMKAFKESCALLNATPIVYDTPDTCLAYGDALSTAEALIDYYKPKAIITHSMADLHRDHRTVAEAVLVAARPKLGSCVGEVYAAEMQPSTEWGFGQIQPQFNPTVWYDVTPKIELKKQVLQLYDTETYQSPDARSVDAMVTRAKHRGFQVGVEYAEALQQIFAVVK